MANTKVVLPLGVGMLLLSVYIGFRVGKPIWIERKFRYFEEEVKPLAQSRIQSPSASAVDD